MSRHILYYKLNSKKKKDYALRKAICGKEDDLGFQIKPRFSRRNTGRVIKDLDYADDNAPNIK